MKNRYRLFQRTSGIFFLENDVTRKQESLRTRDKATAKRILHARNEAHLQSAIDLQIARAYLMVSDPGSTTRTWQSIMGAVAQTKDVTLDGLEPLLKQHFPRKYVDGKTISPKINLIRYADDFIITGTTKDVLENDVKPLVEQFLRDRGLQLAPEKTCVTHIEQGFDFLGQNLRKYGGKLLIQPSKKNTHNFLEKVRQLIRQNRGISQTDLIRQLNPIVRG
jgi:Reverse transcriptase (RNA-dependent DNA polymerase)/Group II intron, maturase-specific domain